VTTVVEGMNVRVGWAPPADMTGVTGFRVTTDPAGPTVDAPAGADHAVLTGVRPNTAYTVSVVSLAGVDESDPAPAPDTVTTAAPGGTLHPIAPVRLLDTRNGAGAPAGATNSVTLQVTGAGGIDATGVGSVVLNVTITAPAAAGFVTVYPYGQAKPTSSNLNYVKGQTSAVLVVAPVGDGGKVVLYSSAKAQLIADASGWFTTSAAASPTVGLFHGLAPARLMDTRDETGGTTPDSGETVDLQVTGEGGVPATGVSAVVLNLVSAGSSASGYVTVYPTGATRPVASSLNFVKGQVVANRVIVPVGTDGMVSFYNFSGWDPLVADVTGWFTDGSDPGAGGGYLAPVSPTRIIDTRIGLGAPKAPLAAGGVLGVAVAGHAGLPAASATMPPTGVIATVTAIAPTTSGYLTVYPSLTDRPTASDLNFVAGAVVPALVVGRIGTDGGIEVFNSTGATNVIVDVFGYFVGDTAIPSTTHTPTAASVLALTGVPGSDQTLTLAAGEPVPPVGDVITGGSSTNAPDGVLGKITATTVDGSGNTVVSLEPVSLQDAFGDGGFAISAALSDADIQSIGTSATRVLTPGQLQQRLDSGIAQPAVSQPVSKILSCSGGGQVSVSGSVSVTPSFNLSVDWSWFSIKAITFTGTLSEDASLSATAQAAASCTVGPVNLGPAINFTPITFSIGPVPVVITPKLQFALSADGNVSAQITTSANQHASGTLGLQWDGGLHPIASTSSSFTYTPPTPGAQASVSAEVGPRIDLYLYGVAGPYLTAAAGIHFNVDPSAEPVWQLTGTLDAGAGIALPTFNFDVSNPSILHYEKVIAHAPWAEHLYVIECVSSDCYTTERVVRANDDGGGQTQIGSTFTGSLGVAVSPDGTKLALTHTASNGDIAIFIRTIATGVDQQVTFHDPNCPNNFTFAMWPTWSPNGQTISFQRQSGFGMLPCATDGVYTIPAGGGSPTKVNGASSPVSWNPGTTRYVTSSAVTNAAPQVYTAANNGSSKKALYTIAPNTGVGFGFPVWSPDGSTVAFGDTNSYVYGYDPNGGRKWTMRPANYYAGGWLSWSRDSESLFYAKGFETNTINRLNVASGQTTSIVFDHVVDYHTIGK
jgi:hypothetical protein